MPSPAAPSPADAAREPILRPGLAILTITAALVTVLGGLEVLSTRLLEGHAAPSLHVAIFFVAFDLTTGSVLLLAARARLAADRAASAHASPGAPPPVSVLIAAYNEAAVDGKGGLAATVRGVAAQAGVEIEILMGDDGSEDRTFQEIVAAFGLHAFADEQQGEVLGRTLRLVRFAHRGKGATLNALAERATHGVLVTIDADTTPAAGALLHLASAFHDPRVDSAAGVVTVRNAGSVLTRHQYAEYVKNGIVRIGWSALGALEQVPGAFAGIRASAFRAVGGFPTDSLTEDYELTYRLVQHGLAEGRVPLVVTVPRAQAFTDVPATVRGFVRQRTRWFAGFLSTLFRFKHLIGRAGAGGFGVVRLPLKLIDAVLPIVAFASLVVILHGAASPVVPVARVALGIFLVRWLWDLTFYAVAMHLSRALGSPDETRAVAPERWRGWLCTATEALTYVWLKHASVLRAYAWAARRVQTWEPSREQAPATTEGGSPSVPSSMVGSASCAPPSVPS